MLQMSVHLNLCHHNFLILLYRYLLDSSSFATFLLIIVGNNRFFSYDNVIPSQFSILDDIFGFI